MRRIRAWPWLVRMSWEVGSWAWVEGRRGSRRVRGLCGGVAREGVSVSVSEESEELESSSQDSATGAFDGGPFKERLRMDEERSKVMLDGWDQAWRTRTLLAAHFSHRVVVACCLSITDSCVVFVV